MTSATKLTNDQIAVHLPDGRMAYFNEQDARRLAASIMEAIDPHDLASRHLIMGGNGATLLYCQWPSPQNASVQIEHDMRGRDRLTVAMRMVEHLIDHHGLDEGMSLRMLVDSEYEDDPDGLYDRLLDGADEVF